MIITCNDLDEFLEELENATSEGNTIYQNKVRLSKIRRPLTDSASQDVTKAVRFEIGLQATTIARMIDGGEYLVQYGEICGIDYTDASQEFNGTEVYKDTKRKIAERCKALNVSIGPGVIDV